MNQYIRLLTSRELSDEGMGKWFDTVQKFAPAGTVVVDDDWDGEDEETFDVDIDDEEDYGDPDFPYVYVVELTRHLEKTEAEFIVAAWEMRFSGDFEIEISSLYSSDFDLQHPLDLCIDADVHENIQSVASKFLHNRWVEKRLQEGWRYGIHSNKQSKVSPMLRDWDSLDESYKEKTTMTQKEAVDFYVKYKSLFH